MYIEELNFSKGLYYALKRVNINDVENLLSMRREELLKLLWIGKIGLHEIEEKMNNYGGGYPLKD